MKLGGISEWPRVPLSPSPASPCQDGVESVIRGEEVLRHPNSGYFPAKPRPEGCDFLRRPPAADLRLRLVEIAVGVALMKEVACLVSVWQVAEDDAMRIREALRYRPQEPIDLCSREELEDREAHDLGERLGPLNRRRELKRVAMEEEIRGGALEVRLRDLD